MAIPSPLQKERTLTFVKKVNIFLLLLLVLACTFLVQYELSVLSQHPQHVTPFTEEMLLGPTNKAPPAVDKHALSNDNSALTDTFSWIYDDEDFLPTHNTTKKILYVIRSFSGRYKSRLSLQARSWMRSLDPENEAILVASQFSTEEKKARDDALFSTLQGGVKSTFSAPNCSFDDHGMGLCCQEAHALVMAATKQKFKSFEWFFVMDEDLFVSPTIMRDIVLDYNESSLISIGTKGCVAEGFFGFCGGGGYLISRPALEQTVALPNFMSTYMDVCKKTLFCDIVTAWIMENNASVTTLTDGRFHPWGIMTSDTLDRKAILSNMDEDTNWLVTHRLVHYRQEFVGMQEAMNSGKSSSITKLLPTKYMFDDLLKRQDVLRAVASRQYATLHYFGGHLTENYKTHEQKTAFLNLLYDVALSPKVM